MPETQPVPEECCSLGHWDLRGCLPRVRVLWLANWGQSLGLQTAAGEEGGGASWKGKVQGMRWNGELERQDGRVNWKGGVEG